MQKLARSIDTNQLGLHQNLQKVVEKYLNTQTQKPMSAHSEAAFMASKDWLNGWQGELIFDSCCGVGESTSLIAQAHPNAKVIGIDKSAVRIDKHHSYAIDTDNYLLDRADLNDFWRLAVLEKWLQNTLFYTQTPILSLHNYKTDGMPHRHCQIFLNWAVYWRLEAIGLSILKSLLKL